MSLCFQPLIIGRENGVDDPSITPYQAQAANVTPPPTYSGENSLTHTYTIENGPYLISTPHSGIVLGIPEEVSVSNGLADKNELYEVVDDSYVKPEIAKCEYSTSSTGSSGLKLGRAGGVLPEELYRLGKPSPG